ncbi:MAG: glycosyltransferase [Gemmataceae bacterium]|nr:glycosyltransferase [Gemmataceae bacterium]
MKILHLVSTLGHGSAAAQLELIVRWTAPRHEHSVCCLETEGPRAARLRTARIAVECLHWTRPFDAAAPLRLRRLLKTLNPDSVHVWGRQSLRALALVGRRWLGRTIVSRPLAEPSTSLPALDRWLLQRVRSVVAGGDFEAAACRNLGIALDKIRVIPPGVDRATARRASQSCHERRILCIGALEQRNAFRDAIWAFDILRYVYPDGRLTVVGAGSQQRTLQWFAQCLEAGEQVEFLGERDDVSPWLSQASVFWSPSPVPRPRQAVLEAMAAGLPVIAADQPWTREVMADGVTGFLVPPGDKVALAKRTRELLADADRSRALAAAAQRHIAQHHSGQVIGPRWLHYYDELGR